MEIAVVGSEIFVMGFRLAGVRKTHVAEPGNLEGKVSQVLDDKSVGILVLDTKDMEKLSYATRRRLESMPKPVVIAVGMREEEDLRTKVKRAIGIDLYKT
jgi:V/A-type H+-transporting ATPase subunit F